VREQGAEERPVAEAPGTVRPVDAGGTDDRDDATPAERDPLGARG